jgi:hypothetical protein
MPFGMQFDPVARDSAPAERQASEVAPVDAVASARMRSTGRQSSGLDLLTLAIGLRSRRS